MFFMSFDFMSDCSATSKFWQILEKVTMSHLFCTIKKTLESPEATHLIELVSKEFYSLEECLVEDSNLL